MEGGSQGDSWVVGTFYLEELLHGEMRDLRLSLSPRPTPRRSRRVQAGPGGGWVSDRDMR